VRSTGSTDERARRQLSHLGDGASSERRSSCLVYHGGADYDCSGGSGNGRYYTAPGVTYTVTGSDHYGLDSNGNGLGCE